ncbi:MAG: site-2 protease family protein [Nitrososphaerota archaeon]|nr:site-2 protease family protein [Nitrososphaerota archaeon]
MESEEFKRVEFQYGVILVRTRRFQSLMDKLGSFRISKPAAWVLLYLLPVSAFVGFYLFLSEASVLLSARGAAAAAFVRTIGPLANLGIPGINPYLPIVDGWLALIIAMVIHEGAHGVVARNLGLPVKSSGLLFFLFVPIGAFVDVDEAAIRQAKPSYAARVLAAGAGINLVTGLVCLLAMVVVVASFTPVVQGAGIVGVGSGTPAANAGLKVGDMVTQIDGKNITDIGTVIGPNTTLKAGQTVNLTVYRSGDILHFPVKLACCYVIQNVTTGQNITSYPYIGVEQVTGAQLVSTVSTYAAPLGSPWQYVCIPTFPFCQDRVPFSDALSVFYTSPLGGWGPPLANLLYWLFFLNFNLAIFNALPIYPLDGGQAFSVCVKAAGRGKLSEGTVMRITTMATLTVLALILSVVVAPYLYNLI